MSIEVEQLHPLYAARIHGVDIRRPVSEAVFAEIMDAMAKYVVCAIGHDAPPTNEEHIAFSRRFGPMERSTRKIAATETRVPHSEIVDQSNMDEVGEIYADDDRRLAYKRANRLWHTDMSFYDVRATYSLLAAHLIPPAGADTQFVDMRSVYDELPGERKREIEGLIAEHSYWHSRVLGGGPEPTDEERVTRPPARHALVHLHKPSNRKTLYLASHVCGVVGWPVETARALVQDLMAFATQPRFVYAHKWRLGDVLIWDNLATMHRATEFDDRTYKRDMRRTTCRERALS
ncbi:MAG: TauD/TfdA dioxygenase family protein [Beijerinckiaceae bacterium]